MKIRSAFAVLSMTVALTACGELPFQKNAEVPEAPAHSGPPAVSPLDQPIETGTAGVPVAMAEASTLGTALFRAAGAGWTATAGDKTAVYERSGQKSVGVTVRRLTYAKGVEFVGSMNGSVFSLNIRAQSCELGDARTPFTARLKIGSQTLTGCAAPTEIMPKAQVKASTAAPKPKAAAKPAAPAAKPAAPRTEPATSTAPAPASTAPAPASTTPATSTPATGAPASTTPATTPEAAPATPAPATPAPASTTPAAPTTSAPAASAPTTGTSTTDTPATNTPAATPSPAVTEPAAPAAVLPSTGSTESQ